jgi:hypothetical protein
MKIQYEIKGITLNEFEMYEIKKYYEVACTAEYIMENYDIDTEEEAMELGYEVRRLMDKYGSEEVEAIEQVISEREED